MSPQGERSPAATDQDVTHDDLVRFWRERNVVDVAAGLDPDRYEVTFFDPRSPRPDHAWDGMAVVWFTDGERGRRVTEPVPEPARRNGFAAMLDTVVRFEAAEHTFFDRLAGAPAPEGAVRLTFLVVARDGVSHAEVVDHWVGVHGPAVAAPMADLPGALRYVASPAVAGGAAGEANRPYVGVTEFLYADVASSKAHAAAVGLDGFELLADNTIFLAATAPGSHLVVR